MIAEEELFSASEARRIISILQNQVRRAEYGYIVKMDKEKIVAPESCEQMKCDWLYRIISKKRMYVNSPVQLHIRLIGLLHICLKVTVFKPSFLPCLNMNLL